MVANGREFFRTVRNLPALSGKRRPAFPVSALPGRIIISACFCCIIVNHEQRCQPVREHGPPDTSSLRRTGINSLGVLGSCSCVNDEFCKPARLDRLFAFLFNFPSFPRSDVHVLVVVRPTLLRTFAHQVVDYQNCTFSLRVLTVQYFICKVRNPKLSVPHNIKFQNK